MARVAVAAQAVVAAGVAVSFTSVTADNQEFTNSVSQRTFIRVKNTDGSDHTVTPVSNETRDGLSLTDVAINIVAGTERDIGPFPAGVYNQTDGTVQLDFSATTGMSCAVITLTAR